MNPLMDVQDLQTRLAAGQRTVLLDERWSLGDPHGHDHYLAGHLPGAVFVDLANELALHRFGRHAQYQRASRLIARLAESSAVGSYLVGSEHRQS